MRFSEIIGLLNTVASFSCLLVHFSPLLIHLFPQSVTQVIVVMGDRSCCNKDD